VQEDGIARHPNESLMKTHKKWAIAEQNMISGSNSPHSLHASGPDQLHFFSCTADWILSWKAIHRNIFSLSGI
jgi:hypothetical protein